MTDVTPSVITGLTCTDQSNLTFHSVTQSQHHWHHQFI